MSAAKGKTVQQAHEGGKMGWPVPQSTVDFFKDIRKPLIRSTPVQTLDHCPRLFLYQYKLGIQTRDYESAFFMGTIVHKILEALFIGKEPGEALTVCERLLAAEQQTLMADAGPDGFLPSGKTLTETLKKMEEDYHKARATGLVFWNFVPFPKDKYEVLRTPDGDPCVELLIDTDIPGLSRPARTPIDLVLLEKGTSNVWIVDHKTSSFDPKVRAIPTKISAQLALYRLAMQMQLDKWIAHESYDPDLTVVGSFHAIIKKPGIKCCGKDEKEAKATNTTPFAAYIKRLVQWYKDADAKDPTNPPLVLDPNRFSGPLMTKELMGRLKQYCAACHASPNVDHFYRVGDPVCLQYNKACSHMRLCNSDPSMWPTIVRDYYQISFREDEEDA